MNSLTLQDNKHGIVCYHRWRFQITGFRAWGLFFLVFIYDLRLKVNNSEIIVK